ncbi:MAG TPA: MBL fold metallo-hydrolase [Ferruginibacter sp.]|nr:MBL fold metallo-hydrolase [Ferruginibacter sp.]
MKIFPLSEGTFTVDKSKVFIPFDKDKDQLKQRSAGSLLVEIQPFVIITSTDIVLLDTGLGFKNNDGTMQIHQNLIDNGINPNDISKVLLSHLHKDHAGGIFRHDASKGDVQLNFPSATYYINKKELEFVMDKNSTSYQNENFNSLLNADKLNLLDDNGSIGDYIQYEMTGGHSPYHTVFWVKENNEVSFFGGDVAPQLQQMKNRFIAKYDYDGKKSMELRTQWWMKGKEQHWTFLFYHDIRSPFIHV